MCSQRTAAINKWKSARDKFINWVESFLKGEFSAPEASTTVDYALPKAAPPARPDATDILAAAHAAFNSGDLTTAELESLKAAAKKE